eukprot:5830884-Pyramimonas_sp.AAC.1
MIDAYQQLWFVLHVGLAQATPDTLAVLNTPSCDGGDWRHSESFHTYAQALDVYPEYGGRITEGTAGRKLFIDTSSPCLDIFEITLDEIPNTRLETAAQVSELKSVLQEQYPVVPPPGPDSSGEIDSTQVNTKHDFHRGPPFRGFGDHLSSPACTIDSLLTTGDFYSQALTTVTLVHTKDKQRCGMAFSYNHILTDAGGMFRFLQGVAGLCRGDGDANECKINAIPPPSNLMEKRKPLIWERECIQL